MEEKEYNPIYVRTDENGIVTKFFSVAFEQPTENDVLINSKNIDRQGANKYRVLDENGINNYCIENGELVERDKTEDLKKIEALTEIQKYKEFLKDTDYIAIKYSDKTITDEEYEPIRTLRIQWRNKINELETLYNLNMEKKAWSIQ